MRLSELFAEEAVELDLQSETKDEVLRELLALLPLEEKSVETLLKTLRRREKLGSTGIGKGIAIPHCRSLVVNRCTSRTDGSEEASTSHRSTGHRCTTSS